MSTLATRVQLEQATGQQPGSTRAVSSPEPSHDRLLPRISPFLLRWFRWYARGYMRRHFHAVRIGGHSAVAVDGPFVVFTNHASWWDPMIFFVTGDLVTPGRQDYAPIDAEALERYAMFKRMGLFGVEQNSPRGAIQFLKISQAILELPRTALWLTPQGRFSDVRERPVKFRKGLGALARRSRDTCFLPVAMEYCYWEERLPEALMWIGEPMQVTVGGERSSEDWTRLLEERLAETQDALARVSIERDTTRLQTILEGGSGVGRLYDAWRSVKARLRGERFRKEHGRQ